MTRPSTPNLVDGRYSIKELIDESAHRRILEGFAAATGLTCSLLSYPDQELLISAGWRDVCQLFHRRVADAATLCQEGELALTSRLSSSDRVVFGPCSHGLVHGATPVFVKSTQVASLITGQVVFEPVDLDAARLRAEQFGFDEAAYLRAMAKVPVITRAQMRSALEFLGELATTIGELGLRTLEADALTQTFQHEIAQRREAERDLRMSRDILERTSDFVSTSTPAGVITYVNAGGWKLLGRSPMDPPLTLRIQDCHPDWSYMVVAEEGLPAASRDGIWTGETAIQNADSLAIPVSQVIICHRDADGEIEFFSTIIRDLTEQKHAAEELANYRSHLEILVAERTQALRKAQEELVQRERLAALGKLTATVAHEIRNPLGTVRSAVFSMGEALDRKDPERLERARTLAERNIQRCDAIIEELLDLTRKRELRRIETPLDDWMQRLLDERDWPPTLTVESTLDSSVSLPLDREQLRRAVINVLDNAEHAALDSEAASQLVRIRTRGTAKRAEIRVQDTGPGIAPGNQARIFEPLFSTKSFGVGLGMTIVMDIMEAHRGGIEVESEQGRGTTITLWLPNT